MRERRAVKNHSVLIGAKWLRDACDKSTVFPFFSLRENILLS